MPRPGGDCWGEEASNPDGQLQATSRSDSVQRARRDGERKGAGGSSEGPDRQMRGMRQVNQDTKHRETNVKSKGAGGPDQRPRLGTAAQGSGIKADFTGRFDRQW